MKPVVAGGLVPKSADLVVNVYRHDRAADSDQSLGTARDVLASGTSLSAGERDAIRNVVDSIAYVQDRFGYAGFNDARNAVKLVLDAADGPRVDNTTLSIPSNNVMSIMPDAIVASNVILPRDAAQHELGHILQYTITGRPTVGAISSPDSPQNIDIRSMSVSEGIADTLAALGLHSWQTGDKFFAPGSPITVARDYDNPDAANVAQHVKTNYGLVRTHGSDPHIEGGVIPATFRELQQRIGWERSEDVLWGVLNDATFGASEQSWLDFGKALDRQTTWRDPDTAAAIDAAMAATHLQNTVN
jgi:hypothetical protein